MLSRLSLTNVASRLPKRDLQQFLLGSKYLYDINHEIWVGKLRYDFDISPSDYSEDPGNVYHRLLNLSLNSDSANKAAEDGDLPVVKVLASLTPSILPDKYSADGAARNGHLKTIKFLASLTPPILPTRHGADWAASRGDVEMLKFLVSIGIFPDQDIIMIAALNGHIEIVKFLASLIEDMTEARISH